MKPGASLAAILPCAIVSGAAMPPVGACLRTLWPALLGDPAKVHAAFALESALLETTYIAGPVLIAGAIGAWSTAASAVTCAVLLAAGLWSSRPRSASRAWRGSPRPPGRGGALRAPGVRTLAVVFVLIGVAFGAVEVAVPAAADAAGSPSAAGWLLGIWGLGSFIGGLLAARGRPPADRVRRLCILLVVLAVGHALLALPVGLYVLAALLLLAGGAIAPSFGLAYGLVDSAAPEGTVTEAFTWLTTGIAAGLAGGSAAGRRARRGAGRGGCVPGRGGRRRGRGAVRGGAAADDHAARRGRAACRDVAVTACIEGVRFGSRGGGVSTLSARIADTYVDTPPSRDPHPSP